MRIWFTILALVCLFSTSLVHGGVVPDIKDNGPEQEDLSGVLDEGLQDQKQEPEPDRIAEKADTSERVSVDEPVSQTEPSQVHSIVPAVHHEDFVSSVRSKSLVQPQVSSSAASSSSSQGVLECLLGPKLRCKGYGLITTCDKVFSPNSPLYSNQCYYGGTDVSDYMTCCTPCCERSWSNDVHKWCTDISEEDFTCPPHDCSQLQLQGISHSGTYYIQPGPTPELEKVWCDMDTEGGGWTVIQSRVDGSVDFDRSWEEYEGSFGTAGVNYWLGLRNMHLLTRQPMELYISMEKFECEYPYANCERAFARYETFLVGNAETNYILQVSDYSGNAGDSMTPNPVAHDLNGMMFSTSDRSNHNWNTGNCADIWGGPWWHNSCGGSALNGKYFSRENHTEAGGHGIRWNTFLFSGLLSLKQAKMMIRPVR